MRQALADALVGFEGALIVISHDRTMLRSVVDDLWLVANGGVEPFNDDLEGYARWLAANRSDAAKQPVKSAMESSEVAHPDLQSHPEQNHPPADSAAAVQNSVNGKATVQPAKGKLTMSDAGTNGAQESSQPLDSVTDRKQQKRLDAERRGKLRPLKLAIEKQERALNKKTISLKALQEELADSELYNDESKDRLADLLEQEGAARREIDEIEEQLLDSMQQLELAESSI